MSATGVKTVSIFKLGTGKGGKSIWGRKFEDEIVPTLKVLGNIQLRQFTSRVLLI
jgi:hypothetical protein